MNPMNYQVQMMKLQQVTQKIINGSNHQLRAKLIKLKVLYMAVFLPDFGYLENI